MYHSNMYPNHHDMWPNNGAEIEHWRIWKILALPYWQLYGELSLDMLKGNYDLKEISFNHTHGNL